MTTLGRRRTKPTLVTSGKKANLPPKNSDVPTQLDLPTEDGATDYQDHEMEEIHPLKRKQDQSGKKITFEERKKEVESN